jgi:CO/xanthine dehydrogenase Mo-binding subunit
MKRQQNIPMTMEEEILARDFSDLQESPLLPPLDRRDFLKLVGGGIVISVAVPGVWAQREGGRRGQPLPEDFNAFLRIGQDGSVTGYTGKIEMGQGIITSLAQMLAEELDVPFERVTMVMGDTDLCPWDMGTFGSMTTRFFGPPFRQAAAEAKAVLLDLAAEHLGVPKSSLYLGRETAAQTRQHRKGHWARALFRRHARARQASCAHLAPAGSRREARQCGP